MIQIACINFKLKISGFLVFSPDLLAAKVVLINLRNSIKIYNTDNKAVKAVKAAEAFGI